MSIALYIAAGLLLACLLLLFAARRGEEAASADHQEPHSPWCTEGSATQIAKHLFGKEDWDYVGGLNSETLKRMFLKERKGLALAWVEAARSEARTLIRVHRTAASTSPHLRPGVELRITYVYAEFLFYCALLAFVIRIRGPVALQSFAELTDARSVRLYEIVGQVFPFAQRADFEHMASPGGGQE